jgi:hypothetical protein
MGRTMKPTVVVVALGVAVVGRLVQAEEQPPAATQEEPAAAQQGLARGRGRGQWGDPRFIEDSKWFHFLVNHRAKIERTIERLPNGVETMTKSDDPEVAAGIRTHVAAMHSRVKEGRGIHLRDPLFREVFRHADRIRMEIADIEKGVRVTETSDDPYVVSLIQAHADVVGKFIENGHDEMRKDHAVPSRTH